MHSLNALFAQVYRRARTHARDAEQIAQTMREVLDGATSLHPLPIYSSARMVTFEQIRLPMMMGAYVCDGASQDELVLAEQRRWFVDRVKPWRPTSRRGETAASNIPAATDVPC